MKKSVSLLPAAALAVILVCGCHSLTEFEGTLHSGVVFIRTDDYTVEAILEGFDDGRAICSINNNTFYVLGSTGTLYKVNSEEMVIDTSFSVWNGPALGPIDILSPVPRSKVYIIGNGSEIIEVSVSSNQVTDIFWAGPSPACMVSTETAANTSIYIGDSQDNRLRQVDLSNNIVVRSALIGYQPYALGIDNLQQFLLVSAYYDNVMRIMNIGLDPIHAGQYNVGSSGTDIVLPANGTQFYMADPNWEGGGGSLIAVRVDTLGGMRDSTISMPGHPVRLSATPSGRYLHILSNTGTGDTILTVLDLFFGGTVAEIELSGYPWDLTLHANGEYVLVLIAN